MTIEELKALEAAATEAPWETAWHASRKPIATSVSTLADTDGKPFGLYGATMVPTRTDADLELCAAARNTLPALLAAIDAMREEIKSAREFRHRLQEYSISYLNANGERSEDMMRRLIAGYSTLKANTDTALAALETKEPKP